MHMLFYNFLDCDGRLFGDHVSLSREVITWQSVGKQLTLTSVDAASYLFRTFLMQIISSLALNNSFPSE